MRGWIGYEISTVDKPDGFAIFVAPIPSRWDRVGARLRRKRISRHWVQVGYVDHGRNPHRNP